MSEHMVLPSTGKTTEAVQDDMGAAWVDTTELNVTYDDPANQLKMDLTGDVARHLLPATTDIYDLGSATARFREIWVGGAHGVGSLNFHNTNNPTETNSIYSSSGGNLVIDASEQINLDGAGKITISGNGYISGNNNTVDLKDFKSLSMNNGTTDGGTISFGNSANVKTISAVDGKSWICSYTHGTELLNSSSHGHEDGEMLYLYNSGGAVPAELSTGTLYYIVNKTANNFQLSLTSGGSAVAFSDNGTGVNSYRIIDSGLDIGGGFDMILAGIPIAGSGAYPNHLKLMESVLIDSYNGAYLQGVNSDWQFSRGYSGANNVKISSGTKITVTNSGITSTYSYKRIKVTKAYTDFAAAGLTNDILIFTLPTGASIKDVYADCTTKFIGGAIASYEISVGESGGDVDEYLEESDVFAAAVELIADTDKGTRLTTAGQTNIHNFSGTTAIHAHAVSTVGDLDAATQGSIDFYIEFSDLQ
ncbi:MAG: hypothetical protein GY861_01020 [bacterium]|nr:hypothetical protein [bacterium]